MTVCTGGGAPCGGSFTSTLHGSPEEQQITVMPVFNAGQKLCSAQPTHKGVHQHLKDVKQTQHQRPKSPTTTLTWHMYKYKVRHKLHQRYIPHIFSLQHTFAFPFFWGFFRTPQKLNTDTEGYNAASKLIKTEVKDQPQPEINVPPLYSHASMLKVSVTPRVLGNSAKLVC